MKHFLIFAIAALGAVTMVATDSVEAKRLGGGRSLGTQRQATPPPPSASNVAPASPVAPAQAMAPGAAKPAGASRWLGPLAGLAAGIGLAALLSHFGLSEGFASILMLVLLVFGGLFLIRMIMARRTVAPGPLRYAGTDPGVTLGASQPLPLATPQPANRFEPAFSASAVNASATAPASPRYPEGFDPAPFLHQSKLQFRKLQAAFDSGDRKTLADVMTPEMFAEIDREIAERRTHVPTDVTDLDADVLDVTTEGDRHWASVHFKGMLREDGMLLPKPFDEIWNLVKPVDGRAGWQLAGIRQLA